MHIRVRRLGGHLKRLSLIIPLVTLVLVMSACSRVTPEPVATPTATPWVVRVTAEPTATPPAPVPDTREEIAQPGLQAAISATPGSPSVSVFPDLGIVGAPENMPVPLWFGSVQDNSFITRLTGNPDDFLIRTKVTNTGAVDIGSFSWDLQFDNELVASFQERIGAESEMELEIKIKDAKSLIAITPGFHQWKVILDPGNEIQEIDERNNVATFDFEVQLVFPDLAWQIASGRDQDSPLTSKISSEFGAEYFLEVSLLNSGKSRAVLPYENWSDAIRIVLDEVVIDLGLTGKLSLPAGEAMHLILPISALTGEIDFSRATHRLRLQVDPEGRILESDETNNLFDIEFEIPLPDLRWQLPSSSLDNILTFKLLPEGHKGEFFLELFLMNSGTATAVLPYGNWGEAVRITLDGVLVDSGLTDDQALQAEQSNRILLSFSDLSKQIDLATGTHRLSLEIDGEGLVLESDTENNALVLEVQIGPYPDRTTDGKPDSYDHAIHMIYLLPSDRPGEDWDTDGTIANLAHDMQSWFTAKSDGYRLLLDDYEQTLDISFFRSEHSIVDIDRSKDAFRLLVSELRLAGFDRPGRIYAIWYPFSGGESICGVGQGRSQSLDDPRPRYAMTFVQEGCRTTKTTMLHEIFHALGAVDNCATYHFEGHVRDYQSDLMSAYTASLETRTLDIGRDDYFGHSIPGCMDLANSPFVVAP